MGDLCSPSPVPQFSSDTQELTARCQEATKLGILSRELRRPGRPPWGGGPHLSAGVDPVFRAGVRRVEPERLNCEEYV